MNKGTKKYVSMDLMYIPRHGCFYDKMKTKFRLTVAYFTCSETAHYTFMNLRC